MAYGKIKADAIIRDNGGSDEEITMATIVGLDSGKAPKASPTFTGTVTVPDVTATGDITLNAQQELRLADSDSSNYIAFASPATVSTNSTWTLPSDAPVAGNVLKVSSVSSNNPTLEWGGGGKVLQVVSARNNTVVSSNVTVSSFTASSTDGAEAVSVSVTRQSSTSIMHVWASADAYVEGNSHGYMGIYAGTTAVANRVGNGYSADANMGPLYGYIASSSLGSSAVTFSFRNQGSRGGQNQHFNAGYGGSGSWGNCDTMLTVIEIEP